MEYKMPNQMINKYVRGKRLCSFICFGGGAPKFRLIPRWARWGPYLSMFWLGTEIVFGEMVK